jgi:hypothetical protein
VSIITLPYEISVCVFCFFSSLVLLLFLYPALSRFSLFGLLSVLFVFSFPVLIVSSSVLFSLSSFSSVYPLVLGRFLRFSLKNWRIR